MTTEPLQYYDVWRYDDLPPLSSNKPILALCDYLYNGGGCIGHEHHLNIIDETTLELTHSWTKCACWKAYDMARNTETLQVTDFTVRKQPTDKPAVHATITQTDTLKQQTTPTKQQILQTVKTTHPFAIGDITAETMEYKCGDVSALFKQALWTEYGINVPIVNGAIADPNTDDGWPHSFVRILPDLVKDTTTEFFIDGTAKQFCDSMRFPQTLGPEETIDGIQTITPNHPLYKYYYLNRRDANT